MLSLSKSQLIVIWMVATILSLLAVNVGIYEAYLIDNHYADEKLKLATIYSSILPSTRQQYSIEMNRLEADYRQNRKDKNFLIGIGIPLVLLGGCTFLSVSNKKS